MFTHKDKIVKDNAAKRREWEKKHPNQDWKTDLSTLDKDKLFRQSKGDNTLFYKKDNIKVQYGEPIELKIDGKKSKLFLLVAFHNKPLATPPPSLTIRSANSSGEP